MAKASNPATQKKVGALSKEDMQYVKDNALKMPVAQIALNLQRKQAPIIKFMKKNNLASMSFTEDEQVAQSIRKDLFREPWWDNVVSQCDSKEEKDLFVQLWIQIISQLGNETTATERLQVKDMVFTEIFANRSQAERSAQVKQVEQFKAEVAELQSGDMTDEDKQKVMYLTERISYLRNSMDAFAQSHLKLSDAKLKSLRELKVSREQRKKNIEESTTNFGGYIKMLMDERRRRDEGFDIESMKVAKDKAYKQLCQLHEFGDGMLDRPILNCDSIEMGESDGQEEV